ncbi:uncharacterized protein BCR38DRAFT_474070 [Pseudomassariella vexata]|uniref:Uncharacterized protein n=1 Tax=Pseudomassariella vexata TaxID=1141098 RepID=A0A1Y2E0T7_9PEZI|nr:uncharacterized protein BCR38DRAFT_474070 [Pseudomassariella vexata]ORY65099.1 hypothetical protein BCR38DRAFT_474070 [Pseudomassariella vexata]
MDYAGLRRIGIQQLGCRAIVDRRHVYQEVAEGVGVHEDNNRRCFKGATSVSAIPVIRANINQRKTTSDMRDSRPAPVVAMQTYLPRQLVKPINTSSTCDLPFCLEQQRPQLWRTDGEVFATGHIDAIVSPPSTTGRTELEVKFGQPPSGLSGSYQHHKHTLSLQQVAYPWPLSQVETKQKALPSGAASSPCMNKAWVGYREQANWGLPQFST